MPPKEAGDPPVSTGGAGFPLSIAATSEHPDAAAAYIDWMTSDHASDLLLQTGQIPLHTGSHRVAVAAGTVLADVVDTAADVTDSNGVVPYEDWATPTFYDTLTAAIQELMASGSRRRSSWPRSSRTTRTSRAREPDGAPSRRSPPERSRSAGGARQGDGGARAPSRTRRGGSGTCTSPRRSSSTPRSTSCRSCRA